MKRQTDRAQKLIAIASLVLNCILIIVLIFKAIDKQTAEIAQPDEQSYDYHSNPYYDAFLSTFQLNERETDVVFLGDSITQNGMWSEFFPDKNILNRGIGSGVSEGVLDRFDEIEIHRPKMIFLMIGCNDTVCGIAQSETVENVEQIVMRAKQNLPNCKVYLQSVLPSNLDEGMIKSLNKRYMELASRYENCTYIDLYPLFCNEDGSQNEILFSSDHVHLNGEGYKRWIEILKDYLQEL